MDLFGRERARLRQELAESRAANDTLKGQKQAIARRAAERQDKIVQLERMIEDLQGDVQTLKRQGASPAEVSAAERALRDAQAIHSEATR